MIVFNYIYYLAAKIIFELRRRMPLYANDYARINSAYAFALLKLFQSPRLPLKSKYHLFKTYAERFSMPVSINRMAETLYSDPKRDAFLSWMSKALAEERLDSTTQRLFRRIKDALSRMPKYAPDRNRKLIEKITMPERPHFVAQYTPLNYHAEQSHMDRFSIAAQCKELPDQKTAILYLPLGRLVLADLSALRAYSKIIVMPQMPADNANLEREMRKILGEQRQIEFYEPRDHHTAPYSPGDAVVSEFCDQLGRDFMEQAIANPSVRRFIPRKLDADLALDISDFIYRPIQQLYAGLRAIESQIPGLPVYYSGPTNALPRSLALMGKNPVFILGRGTGLISDEERVDRWLTQPSAPDMTKGLSLVMGSLKSRINNAIPSIPQGHEPHIFMAVNTWSNPYRQANDVVGQALENIAPVTRFNFTAPRSMKDISKASLVPCLYNALHSADSGERAILSHFIQNGSQLVLQRKRIGGFPASEMTEIISYSIEQNISAIIGNIILYKLMRKKLENVKNAQLLLMPGRHGNIRCLARAFQECNLPTLDVQVLFVSEMARYKPPMADQCAVIDSYSRNRYIDEWGYAPEKIHTIGAINLDDEISKAKSANAPAVKKSLLGQQKGKILTFACQPIADSEVIETLEAMSTELLRHKSLHLCVKLHPMQSEALFGRVSELLQKRIGDKTRYTVLRDTPFWKVMAVTDILVTYFSNVCLMAPAFNVPVITLPSDAPMPELTLADMGLAISADSLDAFEQHLRTVLTRVKTKDERLPPHPYIQKNPHMMNPQSLQRLSDIVQKGFN